MIQSIPTTQDRLLAVDPTIIFSTSTNCIVYGTVTARFIMPGYENRCFHVRPHDPNALAYSIDFQYPPCTELGYSDYFYNPALDENVPRMAVFPVRDVVSVSR
jgi:hypothetical protein